MNVRLLGFSSLGIMLNLFGILCECSTMELSYTKPFWVALILSCIFGYGFTEVFQVSDRFQPCFCQALSEISRGCSESEISRRRYSLHIPAADLRQQRSVLGTIAVAFWTFVAIPRNTKRASSSQTT